MTTKETRAGRISEKALRCPGATGVGRLALTWTKEASGQSNGPGAMNRLRGDRTPLPELAAAGLPRRVLERLERLLRTPDRVTPPSEVVNANQRFQDAYEGGQYGDILRHFAWVNQQPPLNVADQNSMVAEPPARYGDGDWMARLQEDCLLCKVSDPNRFVAEIEPMVTTATRLEKLPESAQQLFSTMVAVSYRDGVYVKKLPGAPLDQLPAKQLDEISDRDLVFMAASVVAARKVGVTFEARPDRLFYDAATGQLGIAQPEPINEERAPSLQQILTEAGQAFEVDASRDQPSEMSDQQAAMQRLAERYQVAAQFLYDLPEVESDQPASMANDGQSSQQEGLAPVITIPVTEPSPESLDQGPSTDGPQAA